MSLYLKIAPNEWKNASRDKRELSVAEELNYKVIVMAKGNIHDRFVRDRVDGFEVMRFTTRPLAKITNSVFANQIIAFGCWVNYARKFNAEIISGHDLYALLIGYLSNCLKKKKAVLIYDSHEMELYRNTKRNRIQFFFVKQLENFLIKKASLNIMVNETISTEVQKIYKLKIKPLVIRNVPSYWELNNTLIEKQRKIFESKLDITDEGFIIMYHGLIGKGNGVELVIKALQHTQDVGLVIMGFHYDEEYFSALKKETQDLNVESRVLFLDAVPIEDLYKYVGASDAGMMVFEAVTKSYFYSLPNKLFENIQALTPVICSDFPEMKKIVEQYNIGLLCNPYDINSIAKSITELKNNKDKYFLYKDNLKNAKKQLCWEKEKMTLKVALKKLK